MQRCLRIALGVFLLFEYLQARAVTPQREISPQKCFDLNDSDLPFSRLKDEIKCGENVTFVSPTNVQKENYGTAMETFREGLKYANTNCIDPWDRTGDALEALENGPNGTASGMGWERKKFKDFVTDMKSFIEKLKSTCYLHTASQS